MFGEGVGKSSGCSFVQMVCKAEGPWEDGGYCHENYIVASRAARASLGFGFVIADFGFWIEESGRRLRLE